MDYIQELFTGFSEMHGDRAFGDDSAMTCGMAYFHGEPVLVVANLKGRTLKDRVHRKFGSPDPEGYRKALRAMRFAEKFARPIFTFLDLAGANPGIGAEAPRSHDRDDHRGGRLGRCAGAGRRRPGVDA